MDDVGKHEAVENDIAAALAPLKSLAAPDRVQEIATAISLSEAAAYGLIQHPGIAICWDDGSGAEGEAISSPRFTEETTWSTWFIHSDSQGGRFARPVLYRLLERATKLLHFSRQDPFGNGRRYKRGRTGLVSGIVGDRAVAVLRCQWRLKVLMREDPA